MAQHKVIDLINQFMEDHGQSSGKDRVMLWFEDVYSKIRRMPWSWNLVNTQTQTGGSSSIVTATSVSATETFLWTQGNSYITSTAASVSVIGESAAGRYVYIDSEWYRCVRISPDGDASKIFLDKAIVAASAADQTLTFYRRDLAFKTNGIKSVHVDDKKLGHLTEEQIYRFKRGIDPRWYYGDSGIPLAYHLDEFQIQPPKFAPFVDVDSSYGTDSTAGTHSCFYTFVDSETEQESAPGPTTEFTIPSGGSAARISYRTASGLATSESSGESTYLRRLYITKSIDTYTRNAAFTAETKASTSTGHTTYDLSDSDLVEGESYYDGPWTRIVMYPAPDEYLRVESLHIDSYFGLPEEHEIVKLGRQREFIELFHLYFLMKQSIQNKDPKQFREMQGSFREQLNFLLAQDGEDRRLDPSSWEYRFFRPDTESLIDSEFVASLKYPF